MAPQPLVLPPPAMQVAAEVEVPSFFRCPISLDLMTDPVSLCTGMTYDRTSIHKWLQDGNLTCPATMQRLATLDLVPNHTLRRLIQDWCVANRSNGVERIPTPRPPATPALVRAMLDHVGVAAPGPAKVKALRRLRLLYKESDQNRAVIQGADGLVHLLTELMVVHYANSPQHQPQALWEEAVGLLVLLPPAFDQEQRRRLAGHKHLAVAAWLLQYGRMEARLNAAALLERIALTADAPTSATNSGDTPPAPGHLSSSSSSSYSRHQHQHQRYSSATAASFHPLKTAVGSTPGVITGLVQLLQGDPSYAKAVKAGLRCLLAVCGARGNRVRAVDAGAVPALVELLIHSSGQSRDTRGSATAANAECAIAVLELLCSCAEGRAAVTSHAMAVPTLVTSLLTISDTATECAVGALSAICQFSPEYTSNGSVADVLELAVEAGVFTKLILLMQADFTSLTKARGAALMRLLGDIWRDSPCSADHGLAHIKPY